MSSNVIRKDTKLRILKFQRSALILELLYRRNAINPLTVCKRLCAEMYLKHEPQFYPSENIFCQEVLPTSKPLLKTERNSLLKKKKKYPLL